MVTYSAAKQAADNPGEGFITIIGDDYSSVEAGTWAWSANASYLFGWSFISASADAEELNFDITLAPGTYSLRMIAYAAASTGIVKIYDGATLIATFDTYSGSEVFNKVFDETGIVITAGGVRTLKFVVDGKNASSSNYTLSFLKLAFWRTA